MDKFTDILEDLISESNLSLRKLGIASKVSAVQYGKYLKGSYPTIKVAIRIANYFKCSLDYLCGITETKNYKRYKDFDLSKFVSRYEKLLDDNKTTNYLFCKKHEISESNLRHWRKGQTPDLESLHKIALYLSSSIDYLVGRID